MRMGRSWLVPRCECYKGLPARVDDPGQPAELGLRRGLPGIKQYREAQTEPEQSTILWCSRRLRLYVALDCRCREMDVLRRVSCRHEIFIKGRPSSGEGSSKAPSKGDRIPFVFWQLSCGRLVIANCLLRELTYTLLREIIRPEERPAQQAPASRFPGLLAMPPARIFH